LQSQAVQPLLSYAIDSSFLMLARRDGRWQPLHAHAASSKAVRKAELLLLVKQ
jgi:hypothetical protein